ncbi:MAG: sulfopyruvate decarboxylase subunit alpha [Chlamydiae bacterium]|nr:sulfopyruvate decarboxylase subunit alpha [Chlamydiota bacterium]MBI3265600.1 sulfopyruvate decarboxylase subunit alpha [Chlamydiota bacterium]
MTCTTLSHDFWKQLKQKGFNFFTGVPCSFLEDLIACVSEHEKYLPAVREDAAMGVAVGAWLGGRKPVLLMQNSGLGVSYNALTSLNLIYKIPVLMVISLRGYQIPDAPEHLIMGAITPQLLDIVQIPYRIPSRESLEEDLEFCITQMEKQQIPTALLMRKGIFGG